MKMLPKIITVSRRLASSVAFALVAFLLPSGVVMAQGTGTTMYWQCVPANAATHTAAGYCPVSNLYPLPISGTGINILPTNSSGAFSGVTVGTSAATIIAAAACKVYCMVHNASLTATVCLNPNGVATISGTQCAAGELSESPLSTWWWDASYVPSDAISAIASAASTQVTVGAK